MNIFTTFWHLFGEMAPYFMLGFFLAGILHVYLPKNFIQKHTGNNPYKKIINFSLLGIPLPLCSCSVIPTTLSLQKLGAPKSSCFSFLTSTPQTGIDSILVSFNFLGLPLTIVRTLSAFIMGITGGLSVEIFDKNSPKEQKKDPIKSCCSKKNTQDSPSKSNKIKDIFYYGFYDYLKGISFWLLLGILIAAIIQINIPKEWITPISKNDWLSYPMMILVGLPLYICSTSSIPIACAFISKGISPGAALVFLSAGAATNFASLLILGKTFGKKSTIIYVINIMIISSVVGLFTDYLFNQYSWQLPLFQEQHEHQSSNLFVAVNAAFLIYLVFLTFQEKINKINCLDLRQNPK